MTEQQLEEILKRRLGLEAPRFDLERLPGGKLAGSVVSNSFRGVGDAERQYPPGLHRCGMGR
jgi:hypothetical protein